MRMYQSRRLHKLLHNAEASLNDGQYAAATAFVGYALEIVKKSEEACRLAQARYRKSDKGKAAALRGRKKAAEKRYRLQMKGERYETATRYKNRTNVEESATA